MAYASEIMQGGFSAGSAKAVQGQTKTGISAAGTVIGDATALTTSMSILSTVASGAGVQIKDGEINDSAIIYNGGANACKVYPPTGDSINQLSASAAVTLATNSALMLVKASTSQWIAFLSA